MKPTLEEVRTQWAARRESDELFRDGRPTWWPQSGSSRSSSCREVSGCSWSVTVTTGERERDAEVPARNLVGGSAYGHHQVDGYASEGMARALTSTAVTPHPRLPHLSDMRTIWSADRRPDKARRLAIR